MSRRDVANRYNQTGLLNEVENASPHRLVQILLEAAIWRIVRAQGCMARGETGPKGENISAALAIVDNLRACLNKEAGGEIAANLEGLYDHIAYALCRANVDNTPEELDRVASLLRVVKSAWDEIAPSAEALAEPAVPALSGAI